MSWVIVTGANGGIGEATVHQLIKNGYSVFAADLAEQPIASFGTYGDAIFRYRAVDVTSEESVTALANEVYSSTDIGFPLAPPPMLPPLQ